MPKKPKGGRRNKDWEKMKAEYVTDPSLSLKDISEKYGVPLRTVKEHSKADNWFATKQEHRKQYGTELAQKLHQKKRESLEQELESVLNISDRISEALSEDPLQFNRYLSQIEEPEIMTSGEVSRVGVHKYVTEVVFKKTDFKSMKDAVQCLKLIEEMKRSMLEMQTANEKYRRQLDADKLQLEKERFDFEKQKADLNKPDSNIVIKIEGFEEGWDE